MHPRSEIRQPFWSGDALGNLVLFSASGEASDVVQFVEKKADWEKRNGGLKKQRTGSCPKKKDDKEVKSNEIDFGISTNALCKSPVFSGDESSLCHFKDGETFYYRKTATPTVWICMHKPGW
jgi:hypothetical protein